MKKNKGAQMDYVEEFEKDFKKVGIAGVVVILALRRFRWITAER